MKLFSHLFHIAFAAAFIAFSLPVIAQAQQITVFAAASLKEAMDEVAEDFETQSGIGVTLSYAGSSTLARQIAYGAPADIFVSANSEWMDQLERDGIVDATSRFDLLSNSLVLIGPLESENTGILTRDFDFAAALGGGRLAMALVDAVPAGIYGKASLEHLGLWKAVSKDVAETDNVRAALALVAIGAAPLGIVYATDAKAEPRVSIVGHIPPSAQPEIRYPVAITTGAQTEIARSFLDHLRSPVANDIFTKYGFVALTE